MVYSEQMGASIQWTRRDRGVRRSVAPWMAAHIARHGCVTERCSWMRPWADRRWSSVLLTQEEVAMSPVLRLCFLLALIGSLLLPDGRVVASEPDPG